MIDPSALNALLPDYLARQPWFAQGQAARQAPDGAQGGVHVTVRNWQVWHARDPILLWAIVDTTLNGVSVGSYQVLIGMRPVSASPGFLIGATARMLGIVPFDDGTEWLAYDALIDPELTKIALGLMFSDLRDVSSVRKLTVGKTSTSVVADEKWLCKVFRRVYDSTNPGVEMPSALWANGFRATLETVESWQINDVDLALRRPYLPGAANGFDLAAASLRELFASNLDSRLSPGDFRAEADRIGEMLAHMHLGSVTAFGTTSVGSEVLVASTAHDVVELDIPALGHEHVARWMQVMTERLDDRIDTMRVHGNLHLGQLLRSDHGWLILDFEGAPLLGAEERRRPQMQWIDVGAMVRSFDYVAAMTSAVGVEIHPNDDVIHRDAQAWVDRNSKAFLTGYLRTIGSDASPTIEALVTLGQIQRATYEVRYERANRPFLEAVPTRALTRLMHL